MNRHHWPRSPSDRGASGKNNEEKKNKASKICNYRTQYQEKKKKKTNAEGTPATSRLVIRGRRTDGDRFCLHIVYQSTIRSILHARVKRKPRQRKRDMKEQCIPAYYTPCLSWNPRTRRREKKKKKKKEERGVQKDGRRSSTLTSPQVTQRLFPLCDSRGGNILNTGVNHVFMCEPALNTSRINRNIGGRL